MQLVFDIGGTNMRIAISSDGKTLATTKTVPTPKDFAEGVQTLKQVGSELSEGEKITKVVGGAAVVLDDQRVNIIKSAHLSKWAGKPLKEELEKAFDCSALLENETALEGLGEAVFGAGKNKNPVVLITIGTGVGGVKIVNGKLDNNLLGFEPGHQIIIPDGNLCICGGKGHLEAYIGGSYLEKIYGQKGEDIKDPEIWDQVAKYLALGLHNSIVHWSPEAVVLGGSVMKSIPLDKVKTHLKDVLTIFPTSPEITRARLGDQAGLFGALSLLKPLL